MCPYHNRIKQRIKNGELVGHKFVDILARWSKGEFNRW